MSRRRTTRKRTIIGASLIAILVVVLGLIAYTTLTADDSSEQASDPPGEATEQEPATSGDTEETTAGEQAGAAVEEQTDPEETSAEETSAEETSAEETSAEETSAAEVPPEETLALYYDYQNVYAWAEAYELLSSRSKERVSSEQYVEFWTAAPDFTINYSFPSVEVQGDGAAVVVDGAISMEGQEEPSRTVQVMLLEDGAWRVVLSEEQIAAFTGAE